MTGATAPGTSDHGTASPRFPFSIAHSLPGRLRLRLRASGQESQLRGAAAALEAIEGVRRVIVHIAGRSLIVEYQPAATNAEALLQAAVSSVPTDFGLKRVEAEMTVPAPLSRVWQVIVEPQYFTLHLPEAVRVTDIRSATHWLVEFTALRRRFRLDVHIVERWPEQRLVLKAEGSFRAVITITLAKSGEQTLVSERVEYELPDGMIAALVGRISSRRLQRGLLSHLMSVADLAADR